MDSERAREYAETMQGALICERCGPYARVFDLEDGYVCGSCGKVFKDKVYIDSGAEWYGDQTKDPFYKARNAEDGRGFHLNEQLAQWQQCEPVIPPVDRQKIVDAARAMSLRPRTKDDVARILASIEDDPQHKTEKTRWRMQSTFKRRTFMIYLERWFSIIAFVAPENTPPKPSRDLVRSVQRVFKYLQRPFYDLRHEKGCTKRRLSCKRLKCRRNFPNYSVVIHEMLKSLGQEPAYGVEREAKVHAGLFKSTGKTAKYNKRIELVHKILDASTPFTLLHALPSP